MCLSDCVVEARTPHSLVTAHVPQQGAPFVALHNTRHEVHRVLHSLHLPTDRKLHQHTEHPISHTSPACTWTHTVPVGHHSLEHAAGIIVFSFLTCIRGSWMVLVLLGRTKITCFYVFRKGLSLLDKHTLNTVTNVKWFNKRNPHKLFIPFAWTPGPGTVWYFQCTCQGCFIFQGLATCFSLCMFPG